MTFAGTGINLALFPAFYKNWWGLKSLGLNYGLLFTSWGLGGFVMTRLSGTIVANTGSFVWSFVIAGTLLAIAAFIALRMKEPEYLS